jgi:hypothetical protein
MVVLVPYRIFSCFFVTIHLGYRLTTDLAQRRRDAEKDKKVFLCVSAPLREKKITKQRAPLVNGGYFDKKIFG